MSEYGIEREHPATMAKGLVNAGGGDGAAWTELGQLADLRESPRGESCGRQDESFSMAGRYFEILRMAFYGGLRHAGLQQLNKASPYTPDGIDVLLRGEHRKDILSFLQDIAMQEAGAERFDPGA